MHIMNPSHSVITSLHRNTQQCPNDAGKNKTTEKKQSSRKAEKKNANSIPNAVNLQTKQIEK
jgi:hypothetical protein